MTTLSAADRLVDDYLKNLDSALHGLPAAQRRDTLEEIRAHIATLHAASPSATEADIRNILDRVGDPEEIAREAGVGLVRPVHRHVVWEGAALVFLLLGSMLLAPLGALLTPLGWLIGVVLLWTSTVWTWRDKVIGTLFLPGGLLAALIFSVSASVSYMGGTSCTTVHRRRVCTTFGTGPAVDIVSIATFLALLLLPLLTTVYLSYRLSRRPAPLPLV